MIVETEAYELVATQKIGKYTISVRLPKVPFVDTELTKVHSDSEAVVDTELTDQELARRCIQCISGKWVKGIFRCNRSKCKY